MGLSRYRERRDFRKTAEPRSGRDRPAGRRSPGSRFVVQKHDASRLHYDFRLELDGTLKSWAVPKGPSYDPSEKRLAVQVEDHPLSYARFEGFIPKGEYGGGEVIVWDEGTWRPERDPRSGYRKGRLEFELKGKKLKGRWTLFRIRGEGERARWLLVKRRDRLAHPSPDPRPIVSERPESVLSRKLLDRDRVEPELAKEPEPELATLVQSPPTGKEWIHEIKFDGYRTLARIEKGRAPKLLTRKGLDWSEKYSSLSDGLRRVRARSALLDGEVVALDREGRSDFGALQRALQRGSSPTKLVYYVFDLLELDGEDLRPLPLRERKSRLSRILPKDGDSSVRFSEHWEGSGGKLLEKGCELGLEGIVSKDRDSPYSSGRGRSWLKSKCHPGQEVVIVGFTPPNGSRTGFGSLAVAANDRDGKLRYLGRVGTGFDRKTIEEVGKKLARIRSPKSPFPDRVPDERLVRWVRPKLVAEIGFRGWTPDGRVRQAVFRGLRGDKPAREVVVELTHPEKILIPETGITKRELRDYFAAVSDWILPHLVDRPIAIVRCPEGTRHECFFQKKPPPRKYPGVKGATVPKPKGGTVRVLAVESESGLESLAQLGAIELHPWGTRLSHPLRPDLLVFDLDPDESVPRSKVVESALRLREILDRLGLRSFVKVSGNKGLHLHVPIEPTESWETAKTFSNAVALSLVEENPGLYLANMSKKRRKGKIFIDFFRNGYGATSIAPYCVRTKNGGAVALPVRWDELSRVDPRGFGMRDVLRLLRRRKVGGRGDPWRKYFLTKQRIPRVRP